MWVVTVVEEPIAYQVIFEDVPIVIIDTVPINGPNFNLELKDKIKQYIGGLTMDKLTYPITGGIEALPSAALIGAGVMGARNIGQRMAGKQHNSLLKDLALGGAGGAVASGAFQLLGSPDSPLYSENSRKMMTQNMDFKNSIIV